MYKAVNKISKLPISYYTIKSALSESIGAEAKYSAYIDRHPPNFSNSKIYELFLYQLDKHLFYKDFLKCECFDRVENLLY